MEDSSVSCAEHLAQYFSEKDNSENVVLSSVVPEICKTEKCCLGVDEAGRGPVLGPMVYGVAYCPLDKSDALKKLGCADSKVLTEEKREELFGKLCEGKDYVGWSVEVIAPNSICNSMLRRQKYSLNQVSHDSAIGLIKKAVEAGVNISEVYVDTVGPADKYQEKLSKIFPDFKITVASKADATYPCVSAASICAKVSRDRALQVWKFEDGIDKPAEGWGSGYPNDPVTKKFLQQNIDPIFGFPHMVRMSWSTADKILESSATTVEWEEEDEEASPGTPSITSFFGSSKTKKSRTQHPFFKERNLAPTASLN
ncbi:ribonuclease H2 subunit A [Thrips palmi]|uniref:Ribonuclease n=1 Tax=Thrips palmi TaxID=161013 RepID=A0A6P9A1H1_THRPL|nr:ribonuclease H2 subunit A [Thrips palmi]